MEEFGKRVEKFRQHIHERDRADYQVLNLSPILTLHECICGLVGIKSDVGDFILGKTHYWKIRRIADSHHDAGTLKFIQTGTLTFWPGQHHANEFMAWAKSIGIEPPEEWQPISKLEDSDNDWKPKKGCKKKDIERFHCVVDAGISLTKGDGGYVPTTIKQFIAEAVNPTKPAESSSYRLDGPNGVKESTVTRSVNSVGNPLEHPKFIKVAAEFRARSTQ